MAKFESTENYYEEVDLKNTKTENQASTNLELEADDRLNRTTRREVSSQLDLNLAYSINQVLAKHRKFLCLILLVVLIIALVNLMFGIHSILKSSGSCNAQKQESIITSTKNCFEYFKRNYHVDGFYEVELSARTNVQVYCEMQKGGWTRVFNRVDGSNFFNRSWVEYRQGFGEPNKNYWIGLENIRKLIDNKATILRIEAYNNHLDSVFFEYNNFQIKSELENYELVLGKKVSGEGIDAFSTHNSMQFSTYDKDNDLYSAKCALLNKAGWWFRTCYELCLTCNHDIFGQIKVKNGSQASDFKYFRFSKMMIKPYF